MLSFGVMMIPQVAAFQLEKIPWDRATWPVVGLTAVVCGFLLARQWLLDKKKADPSPAKSLYQVEHNPALSQYDRQNIQKIEEIDKRLRNVETELASLTATTKANSETLRGIKTDLDHLNERILEYLLKAE